MRVNLSHFTGLQSFACVVNSLRDEAIECRRSKPRVWLVCLLAVDGLGNKPKEDITQFCSHGPDGWFMLIRSRIRETIDGR